MHAPGIWGILVVAVVVLVMFGRGKISGIMGEVGSGIKAFQKGIRDEDGSSPRIDTSASAVSPAEMKPVEPHKDA